MLGPVIVLGERERKRERPTARLATPSLARHRNGTSGKDHLSFSTAPGRRDTFMRMLNEFILAKAIIEEKAIQRRRQYLGSSALQRK